MSKSIRVNQLAKELGVESKAILARCRDEGLGDKVPNQMSVLSPGLAESVRGWFGQSGVATAADVSPRPVRKTIRIARRQAPPPLLNAPFSEAATYSCLVIDGLNVIRHGGRNRPRLELLLTVLVDLLPKTLDLLCICDANTRHVLREHQDTRHSTVYLELLSKFPDGFFESPAGMQADEYILSEARNRGGVVVSNDTFENYKAAHPWISARERFLRINVIRETVYVGRSECPIDRSLDTLLTEFEVAYRTRREALEKH